MPWVIGENGLLEEVKEQVPLWKRGLRAVGRVVSGLRTSFQEAEAQALARPEPTRAEIEAELQAGHAGIVKAIAGTPIWGMPIEESEKYITPPLLHPEYRPSGFDALMALPGYKVARHLRPGPQEWGKGPEIYQALVSEEPVEQPEHIWPVVSEEMLGRGRKITHGLSYLPGLVFPPAAIPAATADVAGLVGWKAPREMLDKFVAGTVGFEAMLVTDLVFWALLGLDTGGVVTQRIAQQSIPRAVGRVFRSARNMRGMTSKAEGQVVRTLRNAVGSGDEAFSARHIGVGMPEQTANVEGLVAETLEKAAPKLDAMLSRPLVARQVASSLADEWAPGRLGRNWRLFSRRIFGERPSVEQRALMNSSRYKGPIQPEIAETFAEAKQQGVSFNSLWQAKYQTRPPTIEEATFTARYGLKGPVQITRTAEEMGLGTDRYTSNLLREIVEPAERAAASIESRLIPSLQPEIFAGSEQAIRTAAVTSLEERAATLVAGLRAGRQIIPSVAPEVPAEVPEVVEPELGEPQQLAGALRRILQRKPEAPVGELDIEVPGEQPSLFEAEAPEIIPRTAEAPEPSQREQEGWYEKVEVPEGWESKGWTSRRERTGKWILITPEGEELVALDSWGTAHGRWHPPTEEGMQLRRQRIHELVEAEAAKGFPSELEGGMYLRGMEPASQEWRETFRQALSDITASEAEQEMAAQEVQIEALNALTDEIQALETTGAIAEQATTGVRAGQIRGIRRTVRNAILTVGHLREALNALYGIPDLQQDAIRNFLRGVEHQMSMRTTDHVRMYGTLNEIERGAMMWMSMGLEQDLRNAMLGAAEIEGVEQIPLIEAGRRLGVSEATRLAEGWGIIENKVIDVSKYLDAEGRVIDSRLPKRIRSIWEAAKHRIGYYQLELQGGLGLESGQDIFNELMELTGEAREHGIIENYLPKASIGTIEYNEIMNIVPAEARGKMAQQLEESIVAMAKFETGFHKLSEAVLRASREERALTLDEQRLVPLLDPLLQDLQHTLQRQTLMTRLGIYKFVNKFYPTNDDWVAKHGPEIIDRLRRAGWEALSSTPKGEALPGLENRLVPPAVASALQQIYISQSLLPRIGVTAASFRQVLRPAQAVILSTLQFVQAQINEQFFNAFIAELLPWHPKAGARGLLYAADAIARGVSQDFMRVSPTRLAEKVKGHFAETIQKMTGLMVDETKSKQYLAEMQKLGVIHASIGRTIRQEATRWIGDVIEWVGVPHEELESISEAYLNFVFGWDDIGRAATYIGLRELGETPSSARRILQDTAVEYSGAQGAPIDNFFKHWSLFYLYRRQRLQQLSRLAIQKPVYPYAMYRYINERDQLHGYDEEQAYAIKHGKMRWAGWEWEAQPWMDLPEDARLSANSAAEKLDGPYIVWVRRRWPGLEEPFQWGQILTQPLEEAQWMLPPPYQSVQRGGIEGLTEIPSAAGRAVAAAVTGGPRGTALPIEGPGSKARAFLRYFPGTAPFLRKSERVAPGQWLSTWPVIGGLVEDVGLMKSDEEIVTSGATPKRAKATAAQHKKHPELARRKELELVRVYRELEQWSGGRKTYIVEPTKNFLGRMTPAELETMLKQTNPALDVRDIRKELLKREQGIGPVTIQEKYMSR